MRYIAQTSWPEVSRDERDMLTLKPPYLGLDFEWRPGTNVPSIVGVSDGETTVSTPWNETSRRNLLSLVERAERGEFRIVGHNILQAEFPLLDAMGVDTRKLLPGALDTILLWYLTHAHLCKGSQGKGGDDERQDGRGFMGIWHMLSVCTSLPYYKECLKSAGSLWHSGACEQPCPEHDVFGYNGIDALGPVLALPEILLLMRTRRVEHLYPMHCELMVALERIRTRGIRVNVDYVAKLRADWSVQVDALKGEWKGEKCLREGAFPFNPESPKQVISYFKKLGIKLDDCTEETIRDAADDNDEPLLTSLLEYKELGDGPDRWFGPKFCDANGYIHPRLNPYTSSSRLMCTSPNAQNLSKRRVDRKTGEKVGKRIRRGVCAPDGMRLYRADLKNAENYTYLWLAGYRELPQQDLHSWMADNLEITEDDPWAVQLGSRRDAAKSAVHACSYLEGIQLVEGGKMRSPSFQRELSNGARIVYPDWIFEGKTVSFTGINLARRAFGSATTENRRRALTAQQKYVRRFPQIKELWKRITRQVETDSAVRPPHGYYTRSFGYPEERMKIAASIWGSQPVAHFTKRAILRSVEIGLDVRLQVHDELLWVVPEERNPRDVKRDILDVMDTRETCDELDGLHIPVEVSVGVGVGRESNWADQVGIE